MKFIGFSITCLLSMHIASSFGGIILKHLAEHKPGGILGILTKPKPPVNFQLGSHLGIGSFQFGFNFGKQYIPPGAGIPKEPHVPGVPDLIPHIPDSKPGIPDLPPHVPDFKPGAPNSKPYIPEVTWEKEKGGHRPNWEEYEEDYPKDGPFGGGNIGYPKHDSFEEKKEDLRPDWEDIGEETPESKSENFMEGDLIGDGLIQPRLNRRRTKRFIESRVYHVPLLFRSNAKPYQEQKENIDHFTED